MRDDDTGQVRPQADPPAATGIRAAAHRQKRSTGRESHMECKKETNLARCNCSWSSCSRKGVCCDCIAYHLRSRELPACAFPTEAERTYDRTFEHFARLVREGKV
jgi:hypothetical protein